MGGYLFARVVIIPILFGAIFWKLGGPRAAGIVILATLVALPIVVGAILVDETWFEIVSFVLYMAVLTTLANLARQVAERKRPPERSK